jgi:hypothetical protein
MIIDQNSSNSIILEMYYSLPLVIMTYLELIDLGAQSISLGIHFSINALMLGLINYLMSTN